MRSRISLGMVLGAVMLTGCSSTPGPAQTHAVSSTPVSGTLTGTVRVYGGPMNPATGKQAANGRPGQDWQVKVLSGTQVVATQSSDAQGRFAIKLTPGNYTLNCSGSTPVTIKAGTRVVVECNVDVP